MGDVAKDGRTILFVSHNMASVEALCDRCLLFRAGRLISSGTPAEVVAEYLKREVPRPTNVTSLVSHPRRQANSQPMMTAVKLADNEAGALRMGGSLSVAVSFLSETRSIRPVLGLVVRTAIGAPIFTVNNKFIAGYGFDKAERSGTIVCTIDSVPLMPGTYSIDLYFGDLAQDYDIVEDALAFEVLPSDVFGTGKLPLPHCGPVFTSARFALQQREPEEAGAIQPERLTAVNQSVADYFSAFSTK
jgi:lipopolysaccharide transport system ATP-binding protein